MSWLLDSNACIRYLNGRAPKLRQRVDRADPSKIVVCSVVKAELFFGACRSKDPPRTRDRQQEFLSRFYSHTFDDRCADEYGSIRHALASQGTPIGPNDLLIAAISIANDLTLVTHNTSEFSRVFGLRIEDWEAEG